MIDGSNFSYVSLMFSFLAVGFSKWNILVVWTKQDLMTSGNGCFEVCFLLFYDKDQWITPTKKAASYSIH